MQSIKTKIIASFLAIIIVMVGLVVAIILINNNLISKYQEINSNIVYEQELKDSISLMVEDCYNNFKTGDFTDYEEDLAKIRNIEKILDTKTNTNKDTYATYLGVRNSLNIVISHVGELKKQWEESGGTTGSSGFFEEVGPKFEFVKQNTTDLILVETHNIASISKEIEKTQSSLNIMMIVTSFFVVMASVVYSFYFAKKVTDPLIILSQTAKSITDGNISEAIEPKLLILKDEIGSLSVSFQNMILSLKNKIDQLEESEKKTKKANTDLEHLNGLMIGRELKMIELKKEVSDLKQK